MSSMSKDVYDSLYQLALERNGELLLQRIKNEILLAGFEQSSMNQWAFDRVRSFLSRDGWSGLEPYITFRPMFGLPKKQLVTKAHPVAVIINRLVGGYRPDKEIAMEEGLPWVFDTDAGIAAAYMFYVTTEPPRQVA